MTTENKENSVSESESMDQNHLQTKGYIERTIIHTLIYRLADGTFETHELPAAEFFGPVLIAKEGHSEEPRSVDDAVRASVYRAVGKLKEKGLVDSTRRRVDTTDSSIRPVRDHYYLTEEGLTEANRLEELYQQEVADVFRKYGARDQMVTNYGQDELER